MDKKSMRKRALHMRREQSQDELITRSQQVFNRLVQWDVFQAATSIMLYMDYAHEVQTRAIIDYALEHDKDVILPVVDTDAHRLVLIAVNDSSHYELSSFGILEPTISDDVKRTLYDIDLVLAPGVAFDLQGNRLGYGGGYYDNLIAEHQAIRHLIKVYALAFECQLFEAIPIGDNDQSIDGIVTEKQIYHVGD